MADASSELIGGRYRVLGNLGKGAMGLVFMAYDPVLDRKVAIKQMTAEIADNEELRQRFYVEARAAARLNHPNIITIHELHESGGDIFMIMELLEGKSLAQMVAAKPVPLPLEATLDVMSQVCDGLDYAHQRTIVHRDIKPANLFLTPSGTVKILDFGIARLGSLHMTAAGALIGTPDYMAPEQIRGDEIDRRTDLWAVGAVLYQLLSGTKPFEGKPLARLLTSIAQTPHVPLQQRAPAIPKSVSDLVDRLLSKPRDGRPASAGLVRDELRAILGRESASSTKAKLTEDEYEETVFMAVPSKGQTSAPARAAATAVPTLPAVPRPVEMIPPGGSMAATAAGESVVQTAVPSGPSASPAAPPPQEVAPPPAPAAVAAPVARPGAAAPRAAPAGRKTPGLLVAVIVVLVVAMLGLAAMGGAAWWYLGQQGTSASAWLQRVTGKAPPEAPAQTVATTPAPGAAPPGASRETTTAPAAPPPAGTPSEPPARVEPATPARADAGARAAGAPAVTVPPTGTPREPTSVAPGDRPSAATLTRPSIETGVTPAQTARSGLTQDTIDTLSGRQSGPPADASQSPSTLAATSRITYVLEQYIQALVNADPDAIREYRAALSPAESALMRARQLKVRLENVHVEVNGTEATARCRRKVEGTSATGSPIQEDRPIVFRLTRRPSGWVITDVR
jgi:serine/threonine-protein kinase